MWNMDKEITRQLKEPVSVYQIPLDIEPNNEQIKEGSYFQKLEKLLGHNLDFHNQDTSYASHDLHPFPAKFPPQLPRKFIEHLTESGEKVLDPMTGSGTTIVEAYLAERRGVGFDIDPLALLITSVKTGAIDVDLVTMHSNRILKAANNAVSHNRSELLTALDKRWDKKTREFIDYWFALETQLELQALISQIQMIEHKSVRSFLELVYSSCIITKSGGVSMAFDLAHTRPHKAKVVISGNGEIIVGGDLVDDPSPRVKLLTKRLRSPLVEFHKRLKRSLQSIDELGNHKFVPIIEQGNSQDLPISDSSIDLIITSPPYASNAIDYIRAHKFSLVWLGCNLSDLGQTRKDCIGGESTSEFDFEEMPTTTQGIINELSDLDPKKSKVLHRYYSEMKRTLTEMFRVLKPEKAAILVVASSTMRGIDTKTQICLSELGNEIGFIVPKWGVRHIERNRRMLPASMKANNSSQIQQRMHEEFVIGFYKPLRHK